MEEYDHIYYLRKQLREAESALVKLQRYMAEHHMDVPKRGGIVEWAINALERYRYAEIEHEHLGCHVAKTGIYANEARETCRTCGRPTR